MRTARLIIGAAFVLVLALASATTAAAYPITWDFTVTATSGPLIGTSASGSFSYDSSLAVPNAFYDATSLLTALSFTWDGITYNQTAANTGSLLFDSTGDLFSAAFGSDCSAGSCVTESNVEGWLIAMDGNVFGYGGNAGGIGAVTFTLAPEPSTLSFLTLGGLALAAVRRKQRRG